MKFCCVYNKERKSWYIASVSANSHRMHLYDKLSAYYYFMHLISTRILLDIPPTKSQKIIVSIVLKESE